jgi:hypothetical protein
MATLNLMSMTDLTELASMYGVRRAGSMNRQALVFAIARKIGL